CAPTTATILQLQPRGGGGCTSWPAPLPSLASSSGGWDSVESAFTASGVTYHATVLIGPDASGADREALLAAYASMEFPSAANGVVGGAGTVSSDGSESVSTVVAGGSADSGDEWVLEADGAGGLFLQTGNMAAGFGVASASGDGEP